jgi:glycosyltransferase involved in cell wall biosynthesis
MADDPLHLLCIEPRFPGRLGAVADWLVRRRGCRCWFYCAGTEPRESWPASTGKGLDVIQFGVGGVAREAAVPWMRHLERGLCYAYGCWEVLENRRPRPVDLVVGRSAGLGSTLFVPTLYAGAPIVNLFDYYYHAHAHDLAGDTGSQLPPEYYNWRRSANAMDLLDLENGVKPWTTTHWQRDLYPAEYRDDFLVQHDGVDERRYIMLRDGVRTVAAKTAAKGTKVVSFVAQSLERLRGFDRFIELANRLMRWSPDVVCIAVGASLVKRGLDVQFFDQDYRAHVLERIPVVDPARLWLLGSVAPADVVQLLRISDLHVYPSRPYVVSRSLVEAMASGCVVLAWDSEAVREFITPEKTGLLVLSDDMDAAEEQACAVLSGSASYQPLARAAAAFARERYSQEVTMPALATFFTQLVNDRS